MWNSVIDAQLQHLGINHDQAAFLGRQLVKQRQDHRIDGHGLARASCTSNQKVGHLGKVGHHRVTADILAQCKRQTHVAVAKVTAGQDFAKHDLFPVLIRQFDANHRPTRHRRHARRQGRHGPCNIIRQANHTACLEAGCGFKLVHRDHGARPHRNDFTFDPIIVQHAFQHSGIFCQCFVAQVVTLNFNRIFQQVQRGQFKTGMRVLKAQIWLCLSLGPAAGLQGFAHMLLHNLAGLNHRDRKRSLRRCGHVRGRLRGVRGLRVFLRIQYGFCQGQRRHGMGSLCIGQGRLWRQLRAEIGI